MTIAFDKANEYVQVIDDALTCWGMVTTGNALDDLNKLLCIEQQVAVDPAVSDSARALQRQTAADIIQYIEDQGTIETRSGLHVYYVSHSDIKTLKEKYDIKNQIEGE